MTDIHHFDLKQWDGASVPDLLTLERLDRDLFRNQRNQRNLNGALFGGQVLAQSLTAATHSVDDGSSIRPVHSLHGYFLRAGQGELPVIYQVDRTRDGGRFSTRRVIALQNGEPIFHMECGFHQPEAGFDHQSPIPPTVTPADQLLDLPGLAIAMADRIPAWLAQRWSEPTPALDVRPVDPEAFLEGGAPQRQVWMRIPSGRNTSPSEQACLLAWLSDYWLAGTAAIPHTTPMPSPTLFMASLDHAMWFHRPVDVAQWMLFDCESPSAQSGRGFSRGLIHSAAGELIASVAQEALMRQRR